MIILLLAVNLSAGSQFELPRVDTTNYLPAIRAQIHEAEEAARTHPREANTLGHLAMVFHAYQQYDAAVRVYTRALSLQPANFDWAYLLGSAQKAKGAFQPAAVSFRSALRMRPDDLPARLRLAETIAALGEWDAAGASYRRILDKHTDSPQAWYGLGRVQTATGDHEGAVRSYTKACEMFRPYGAAHFALAAELRRLGDQAGAQQHLKMYSANVTVEPPLDDPLFKRIHDLNRSSMVHLERGIELEKAGRYADAIREHEAALESDPDDVQAHINLISLYGRTGDSGRARQHFEKAMQLNPGRSDAWYSYGVLLSRDKQYEEAESAYRRALEINPYYAEAHMNLGILEQERGAMKDAEQHFRQAVASRPDYALARFHLGRVLAQEQNYAAAISHFRRCVDPESEQTPPCLYALGATYARSGDRSHAVENLERARSAAIAHRQTRLQISIERDLKTLRTGQ